MKLQAFVSMCYSSRCIMAIAGTFLTDQTSTEPSEGADALQTDPRLELLTRIVHTPTFEKAFKLQALLRFIVEQSLQNDAEEITELRIGIEVFGKGSDYSPLLDSSVRVQARQLRLKLHEYFNGVGKDERIILEIPKGSYRPIFQSLIQEAEVASPELPRVETGDAANILMQPQMSSSTTQRSPWVPWTIACVAVAIVAFLLFRSFWNGYRSVPWPLATIMDRGEVIHLVLADSAYQITATANGRSMDLGEYLRAKPRNNAAIDPIEPAEVRLAHALSGGTFTSFADVVMVNSLANVAGRYKLYLNVKSARDLDPRDLEDGNFIFSGSPSSNPWVSLYNSKLNFRETDSPSRPGEKMFLNTHPRGSEAKMYTGSSSADAVRVDYADLAVVPGLGEHGTVMIVEGLRHEATEAAARMLVDPEGSKMLEEALRSAGQKSQPAYFEALLSVRAVEGIPQVTGVVAIRTSH
ncbi:MAG: hypothetical protein PW789_03890 [Edaphobacter sp.]|uniref:hypothetical protein n=1 Tax=Edaphobacter sp. TaxID=1934404 RepID=UPI00239F0F3C|nr:hypothetical protein [Edaphobacter sp.]MDE1175727.1 hypothetical protein [Edaphobacter sp.]